MISYPPDRSNISVSNFSRYLNQHRPNISPSIFHHIHYAEYGSFIVYIAHIMHWQIVHIEEHTVIMLKKQGWALRIYTHTKHPGQMLVVTVDSKNIEAIQIFQLPGHRVYPPSWNILGPSSAQD
jgi:hypothetical protein